MAVTEDALAAQLEGAVHVKEQEAIITEVRESSGPSCCCCGTNPSACSARPSASRYSKLWTATCCRSTDRASTRVCAPFPQPCTERRVTLTGLERHYAHRRVQVEPCHDCGTHGERLHSCQHAYGISRLYVSVTVRMPVTLSSIARAMIVLKEQISLHHEIGRT